MYCFEEDTMVAMLGSTVDTLREMGETGSPIRESSLSKRKIPCPTTLPRHTVVFLSFDATIRSRSLPAQDACKPSAVSPNIWGLTERTLSAGRPHRSPATDPSDLRISWEPPSLLPACVSSSARRNCSVSTKEREENFA